MLVFGFHGVQRRTIDRDVVDIALEVRDDGSRLRLLRQSHLKAYLEQRDSLFSVELACLPQTPHDARGPYLRTVASKHRESSVSRASASAQAMHSCPRSIASHSKLPGSAARQALSKNVAERAAIA